MSFLSLACSAVVLGFMHGLGADHLMAIAALAVDGERPRQESRARAMNTAVGFAVGHTVVLGLGVAVAVAFGFVLPVAAEAGAERVGGVLLIGLGMIGLWGLASGRTYSHAHAETDGRARWHLHVSGGSHPHGHSRVPVAIGAVFAVSSLRALMLLQPFGSHAQALALPALLLLVMLFGFGILLSMSLFGVLLARVLSLGAAQTMGRLATGAVAVASILLGVYWMGFWR